MCRQRVKSELIRKKSHWKQARVVSIDGAWLHGQGMRAAQGKTNLQALRAELI